MIIFDLGFHNGTDAEHYLEKGFLVVAVEPNPNLCKEARKKFKNEIEEGRLILIEKAISSENGSKNFFLHQNESEWSSLEQWLAERDGTTSTMISVQTTTVTALIEKYGLPHYIKVDTEGEEINISQELAELKVKPQYVSFETSRTTYMELFFNLKYAGYKKFQLRNQLNNTKYSSGAFGESLPDKWFDYRELIRRYTIYAEMRDIDSVNLALGWLDVHASL